MPCLDLSTGRVSVVAMRDCTVRQRAASFFEIRRALTAPGATVIVNEASFKSADPSTLHLSEV